MKDGEADTLLVTVPQAAVILGVGISTVKKLIREKRLKSVLIFGARRIPMAALRELAEQGTEAGDGDPAGRAPAILRS